ncbi:6126_t:CDS:2 [Gigaspora margarita]|uniref:6126_t:CDS:1 n=1 Tax=Gigaspora margarita TaxID=4874 RepID=A0ABN7UID1_GIGMA|nr:6126_t:CDS:2 [Gigaspora margarita]
MLLYKIFIVTLVVINLLTYLTIALPNYESEKHKIKDDKLEEDELEKRRMQVKSANFGSLT